MPKKVDMSIDEFINSNRPISISLTKLNRERLVIMMDAYESENRSAIINRAVALMYNVLTAERKKKREEADAIRKEVDKNYGDN